MIRWLLNSCPFVDREVQHSLFFLSHTISVSFNKKNEYLMQIKLLLRRNMVVFLIPSEVMFYIKSVERFVVEMSYEWPLEQGRRRERKEE